MSLQGRRSRPSSSVLPGLAVLRSYQRRWLWPDVIAGLTVAAYAVPQCMAYAEAAGLPAVVGLWTVLLPLTAYAALGSSRLLSVGPESTTAVMTAAALAPLVQADPARYALLAAALALLVALCCAVAFVIRLGVLADLLSKPVLVGYMAGVAVIMIVGQLAKVTGTSLQESDPIPRVLELLREFGDVQWEPLLLATFVVVLLFVLQWKAPRVPGPIVAVLAATVVAVVRDLDVAYVGSVTGGLPRVQLPGVSLADLRTLVGPAVAIAFIGFSDNVLTARAFARDERVDANQELLALGAANLGAGITQGFPVSSSGSRTAIIQASGGHTQLAGLTAAASVVVVLLVAGGLLEHFPLAALGGIVIYAATRLVELPELRRFARLRWTELALALLATVGVVVVGVLLGILIAVGLSVVDMLVRVARPHWAVLGKVPGLAGLHDVTDFDDAATTPGLVVFRYDAPLFFANADDFVERALAVVDGERTPVEWFLLNAEAIVSVDITAADAIDDLRDRLTERGVQFTMARAKQDLQRELRRTGALDRIGAEWIFPTLPTALDAFNERARGGPAP
ncbi:MAG TPA: SulP family inorganic anion transporter [Acidimicrobiales bacterium]